VIVFPSDFPTKIPYSFLFRITHATCTTHFILLQLAGSTFVTVLLLRLKTVALNDAYSAHRPQLWRFVTHYDGQHYADTDLAVRQI